MYICVVKRFGRFGGVTHLVKGSNESLFVRTSLKISFGELASIHNSSL